MARPPVPVLVLAVGAAVALAGVVVGRLDRPPPATASSTAHPTTPAVRIPVVEPPPGAPPLAATTTPARRTPSPPGPTGTGSTTRSAATPSPGIAPPAGTTVRWTDPADVAVHWVRGNCTYSWHDTYDQQYARLAPYSSPSFRAALAPSASSRGDWQRAVVDTRTTSRCPEVRGAIRANGPNTHTTKFVRVQVSQATRAGAAPEQRVATGYPLRLVLVGGRWLVDGYSPGD